MNTKKISQWKRREGYGGPESFPENELAAFAVGETGGRMLEYVFIDTTTLSMNGKNGRKKITVKKVTYSATEAAPGIFFVKHGYNRNKRLTTCLVLDLNRDQTTVIDGEIPAEGDSDYRVRKSHVGGVIGKPAKAGDILPPPFPTDVVGKRFVAEYSGRYAWELIYMNKTRVAWQGLKGNPGIGDTEEYHANQFAPGVYVVSWSEESETLCAVFLYNFNERTITGHMWGYAPETGQLLHAPLGARIVDSSEFGLPHSTPDGRDEIKAVLQRNKDVVLRTHYEVWNRGRYDLIPELYSEDFACHFICGLETSGQDGVREFISNHHKSFPDWTERVVDIIADGDRVVTRYISTGTHKGDFQGIKATGRKTEIAEVSIHRVLNGRIVEQWGFPDGLHHVQQMTED